MLNGVRLSARQARRDALWAVGIWLVAAMPCSGQTPPGQCALDSLILVSPGRDGLSVRLASSEQRFGAVVQWHDLSKEMATCAVTTGTQSLPFSVTLDGVYADRYDRLLQVVVASGGVIGSPTQNRVVVSWYNAFPWQSGNIAGEFNLSNNGGLWQYDRATDTWSQNNRGLPQTLRYTRILAMAVAPGGTERLLHLGTRGLWRQTGSPPGPAWERIGTADFTNTSEITAIAYAPDRADWFVVGTTRRGIFVTRDAGLTFTQFAANLDPQPLVDYNVSALTWAADGRLFAAVRNLGVFVSNDGAQSFVKLPNLLLPLRFDTPGTLLPPRAVHQILVDPTDPQRIYFAVPDYALYVSPDGGQSWAPATASWIVPPDGSPVTGLSVVCDPNDTQVVLVGTADRGIWRTTDGGATWSEVGVDVMPFVRPAIRAFARDPAAGVGVVLAAADNLGVMRSEDGGENWVVLESQPGNRLLSGLVPAGDGSGALYALTYDGGIYEVGTPLRLADTYLSTTDPAYQQVDLGLSLSFGAGLAVTATSFQIKCQDFQGWAVWRSDEADPMTMQLVAIYDKTNPLTCLEGFCGDPNYTVRPGCFAERRASCFRFGPGDLIEYFDDSVYNGFTYFYAVTAFDYGSTAGVAPTALINDMLFSPRFDNDPLSRFPTPGNQVRFQVNPLAAAAANDVEIYCYPNPLRRDAGLPGGEGERVVFTNLPAGSRIRVYTEDGDLVAELGTDLQLERNLYWNTRNQSGQLLASGVYFWKVEMPARGDYYGRLVIIR